MSKDSSIDRASFQEVLASAFAVQESHIDGRFLSAFLGVQQSVATGELSIDGVMNLIVDSARDVAGAAGVAIGLLERDQLIYRAGSGCSASWIGAKFAASLTVSAKAKGSREILRVENASTDTRIEGAICRQFGAKSLLILPIYRDRLLAGVMEILFTEPHDYHDGEVRMYRLMAGLIEEAMGRPAQPERTLPAESPTPRNAFEETPRSAEHFTEERLILHSTGKNSIFRRCGTALAAATQSPALRQPRLLADIMVRRATEIFANKPLRTLALERGGYWIGADLLDGPQWSRISFVSGVFRPVEIH